MLCPSCHTQNRDNAKFCKGCGMSFTPEMLAAASNAQRQPQDVTVTDHNTAEASSVETSGVSQSNATQQSGTSDTTSSESGLPAGVSTATTSTGSREEEDISVAPTLILSPEQMIAYQARRWQQETEREHSSGEKTDISNAPTMLFSNTPPPTSQAAEEQPDVSHMPTVIMSTDETGQSVVAASSNSSSNVPSDMPATPTEEKQESPGSSTNSIPITESPVTESSETKEAARLTQQEEETMEQGTPKVEGQAQPIEHNNSFPTLPPGTSVIGRYEITQVLSETEGEHLYQVIDHQGYKHCWNCGSEENAEGDDFCIDCGAELDNASYTLHEYPAAEGQTRDSHVLHGNIINTFVDQGRTYVVEQLQTTQTAFPNGVHLLVASDSDAGNVRRGEPNEDSTLILQMQRVHESISTPVGVFIVADGMGGHANGQGASRLTISTIAERITRELLMPPLTSEKTGEAAKSMDEDSFVTLLQGAVEDANTALCQINQQDKTDMGSTITGFMLVGDLTYILNVGDSRTYMLRDKNLYQLTNDHSLVGQLVAGGLIEPDDVYTHPQRSQIYRSLGDKPNVQIDIFKQQVHPGDILLSCSDGLWEMIRNPQISDILSNAPDPQTACTQLIEAANTNGGEDNVSAVVVFVR